MANSLPYFKWFPADAESDEKYAKMNDTELGFYHRCLNKAWRNGASLPGDQNELARMMKVTPAYLKKMWKRVGECFKPVIDDPLRVENPRQGKEFKEALTKSERNANAARTPRERKANDTLRALAGADYDSDSGFKKLTTGTKPKGSTFLLFWARWCELTKRKQHEGDACHAWLSVVETAEQVGLAMACLERYGASADVAKGAITNPEKWIYEQARDGWRGDWQPPPKNKRDKDDMDVARKLGLIE